MESWISSREPIKDGNIGHSIDEVEELIKKQAVFEAPTWPQEDKLAGVNRITSFMRRTLLRRARRRLQGKGDPAEGAGYSWTTTRRRRVGADHQ